MAALPSRRRFTVKEYYKLAKAGILSEDDRVELIEGEIVQMPPIGGPHSSRVIRLTRLLGRAFGDQALVIVQGPLRLSDRSEPLPDLVLARFRDDYYEESHATAADVFLVVEVCDSSLTYDRQVKLPLYARESVPEVWLVEIGPNRISVHRDPSLGRYQVTEIKRPGERISPLAFPDIQLAVDDILGRPLERETQS